MPKSERNLQVLSLNTNQPIMIKKALAALNWTTNALVILDKTGKDED